jgi:hypothetical protein
MRVGILSSRGHASRRYANHESADGHSQDPGGRALVPGFQGGDQEHTFQFLTTARAEFVVLSALGFWGVNRERCVVWMVYGLFSTAMPLGYLWGRDSNHPFYAVFLTLETGQHLLSIRVVLCSSTSWTHVTLEPPFIPGRYTPAVKGDRKHWKACQSQVVCYKIPIGEAVR